MKQYYKLGINVILFILLAAAYVAKMRDLTSIKRIPSLSALIKSNPVKAQPKAVHDTTMASIQQSLAKREYNISFDTEKNTLQSPNRKQGLRAYYKPGELTVNNRVDSAGHNFSLKLVNEGIFADGKKILMPQSNAKTENADNKLQIKHKGFIEEFVNNEEGVRQNFIIDFAPVGTKELQVRLSVKGLKVHDLKNNELKFYAENKKRQLTSSLIYKDIKCWDTDGKMLPATLRYENGLVMLSANVQNAAYPVTIDPIVVNGNPFNANSIVESNQIGAQAGYAVSSAGDVNGDGYSDVLVGAPLFDSGETNEGVVFVYHGSASGLSVNAAIILQGNQTEAQFGTSAASAGDINKDGFSDIIIGAPFYHKGESKEGVAMIYYGSASGLSNNATILEGNQANARFGRAVEGLGDVNGDGFSDVIVGAPLFDKGQTDEGAAFIYHGSAAGISPVAATILDANQEKAQYGYCSAGAGDVNGDGYNDVIVGAYAFDKGHDNEGAVFVYLGSAIGIGNNSSVILEGNQLNAQYGWSAATAGDVNGDGYSDIMVGSYLYDFGQTNEGAVFVYHGSAQGIKAAALKLESNQPEAKQGISVACAGDVNGDGYSDVMIGIWQYDKGENNEGAVVLHHGSPSGLISSPASTLESNQADAGLGWSVKSAGDVNGDGYSDIIVGANTYDTGQTDEGGAFVWLGGAFQLDLTTSVSLDVNQSASLMAWSVAGAGDVNGDGFDDVIIGAPDYDNGQSDEGVAFLYNGTSKGVNDVAAVVLESNQANAAMGKSVATAGDVNGDGYSDIIIGVIFYSSGELFEGGAFIYYGSINGIDKNKFSILQSNQPNALMGRSVSSAGDVNADGFGDVIVGAEAFDNGQFNEGAIFLYLGSANGINQQAKTKIESNQDTAYMGYSVANAGDLNSDGFSDVVVGLPYFSNGETWEGTANIYYGSADGLKSESKYILEIDQAEANFGWSVASVGDVNADGYPDILVGAPQWNNGTDQEGAVFLYYGSAIGPTKNNVQALQRDQKDARMGESVSGAGDVNGDGYSDIIIGAPHAYKEIVANNIITKKYTGKAYLYVGSGTGIIQHPISSLEVFENNACFGQSVAGIGDVNNDGYSDIAVGAPYFNGGTGFVAYGNTGICLQNNLRLYNSNLTTPINQTQKAKNDFGAGLYAKSFLGKNKGKMVWETKAKGQGFSKGTNGVITNSMMSSGSQNAYASLGLTGTELKNVIAKQGPSTKVRVRVKYDPALALTGQLYGPWRYLPAYLVGNSIAPAPEDVVDDMSETVKRKVEGSNLFKNEKILVYPNPATDKIFIDTNNPDSISHLQLFTLNGKSIYKTAKDHIDVRGIDSGMHILVISYKDGSQTSRKVMIGK